MEIKIELGLYEDLDAIEQLYNDLTDALEAGTNYPGWKKDIYPTREDAQKGIQNKELYIAKQNDIILGTVILNHKPEPAYDSAPWQFDAPYDSIFVVHTLAVHPSYTKLGIGRKLLQFAENLGHSKNITIIRLDVYEHNMPAISLYKSLGYQYVATVDLGHGVHGLDWFFLFEKSL